MNNGAVKHPQRRRQGHGVMSYLDSINQNRSVYKIFVKSIFINLNLSYNQVRVCKPVVRLGQTDA
jgi:hypothetical protein